MVGLMIVLTHSTYYVNLLKAAKPGPNPFQSQALQCTVEVRPKRSYPQTARHGNIVNGGTVNPASVYFQIVVGNKCITYLFTFTSILAK